MAITSQDPIPPLGCAHYHRQRASPNHYCIHQGSETPLTYPADSHPRTRGAPQCNSERGEKFLKEINSGIVMCDCLLRFSAVLLIHGNVGKERFFHI
ncbi:hypothetical protein AVEN_136609-1 [Araneus ventricosus]|uniref:Uncharacterized protein n=1 Tax=Araneus ventricosus TaxID=182803 RepID=A0A4Y2CB13_ARAVE|nr:hypothetical protein AVEN_136609-1 [Araneus ventricosus]